MMVLLLFVSCLNYLVHVTTLVLLTLVGTFTICCKLLWSSGQQMVL